jgi:DNA polymerase III gamma/tau subunit
LTQRKADVSASAKETNQPGFPVIDLGNERVRRFLDAAMRDRLPSLLFTGPEGVGKEFTAIDFVRRLLCEKDAKCRLGGDLCRSCREAVRLEHPSLHFIYPTPTQGTGEKEGDDETDVGKVLEEKRQNLFQTYRFAKKASIRIARARAIIKQANIKPFAGGYNVFIVVDAHLAREEAQNALLKLVEEPPDRSVLIFITPNPDAILYTIRSRCQRVRFPALKPAVIRRFLTDYYGFSGDVVSKAAELAQGSIRRARDIAEESDDIERAAVYELLERLSGAPESWLIGKALALSRGRNRDAVARFLHEFSLAYRDIMSADEKLFINQDQKSLLSAQKDAWDPKQATFILDRIMETRDRIHRRNANMDAALVDLFLEIKHTGC